VKFHEVHNWPDKIELVLMQQFFAIVSLGFMQLQESIFLKVENRCRFFPFQALEMGFNNVQNIDFGRKLSQ
jgi:hypothetical protein